jgi:hypothetical protein
MARVGNVSPLVWMEVAGYPIHSRTRHSVHRTMGAPSEPCRHRDVVIFQTMPTTLSTIKYNAAQFDKIFNLI